jgi:hypothetical protein
MCRQAPAGPTRAGDEAPYARGPDAVPPLPFGPVPPEGGRRPNTQAVLEGSNDARTGMPPGIPGGAMCVQRLDDSLNSAIHITYRISLRSSSMPEPRDPLLKVLTDLANRSDCNLQTEFNGVFGGRGPGGGCPPAAMTAGPPKQQGTINTGGRLDPEGPHSVMILPQVHLRKPCYDFYFL